MKYINIVYKANARKAVDSNNVKKDKVSEVVISDGRHIDIRYNTNKSNIIIYYIRFYSDTISYW